MQNPKKQPHLAPTPQNVLTQLRAQSIQQSSLPPLRPNQSVQSPQLLQAFVGQPLQIARPLQLSQQLRSQQPSPQSATPSQVLALLLESQPQLRPQVSSQRPQLLAQQPQLPSQRSQQVNQFVQLLQPSQPPQLIQPVQPVQHQERSPVNDLNLTSEQIEIILQRKKDIYERFYTSIKLLERLILNAGKNKPISQQSRVEQSHKVLVDFFNSNAAPVPGTDKMLDRYEAHLNRLMDQAPGWCEKLKLFEKELEKQRPEKERLERERFEGERFERERLEVERIEKIRLVKERLVKERLEKERLAKSEKSLDSSFGKLISAIENATSPKNAPMYAQNVKFISDAMAVLIPEPYQLPKSTNVTSRKEPLRNRAVRILDNRFAFKSVSIRKVYSPNQPLDPPFSLSVRLSDYHPFDFVLPNLPTALLHIPFDYNDRRNARLTFDDSWTVTPLFIKVRQRYEQNRMQFNNQDFHSLLESFYQAVLQTCLGGTQL